VFDHLQAMEEQLISFVRSLCGKREWAYSTALVEEVWLIEPLPSLRVVEGKMLLIIAITVQPYM